MGEGSLKEINCNNKTNKPLVSVAIIAYNVGNYISETIDSVLSQDVNFKYEIVIGEDCSSDNTKKILKKYEKKFPGIIKVLYHKKNLGLTPNSIITQNACVGKYIALLDGDDYWINDCKLTIQVDFLEKNLDFSAIAHQSDIIKGDKTNFIRVFGSLKDEIYTINDTISHRKFHTSSLVYRRELWIKSGGIPSNISSNERAIYPMLAIYGKIKYLSKSMCVYRLSPTGLNSKITTKELETDLNMLPWLKNIDKNFPLLRFRAFLHLCMFTYPSKVPLNLLIKHFLFFSFFSFSYFPINIGDIKYGLKEMIKKINL